MIEKLLRLIATVPQDKLLHFIGGTLIACVIHLITKSFSLSFVAVAFVAALKEYYDYFHPNHTADVMDWVATMLGGVPVWLILWR